MEWCCANLLICICLTWKSTWVQSSLWGGGGCGWLIELTGNRVRNYSKTMEEQCFCQSKNYTGIKVEIIFNKCVILLLASFIRSCLGLPGSVHTHSRRHSSGPHKLCGTKIATWPQVTLQSFLGLLLSWQRRKQEENQNVGFFLMFSENNMNG